jgi:hypothetical protein
VIYHIKMDKWPNMYILQTNESSLGRGPIGGLIVQN